MDLMVVVAGVGGVLMPLRLLLLPLLLLLLLPLLLLLLLLRPPLPLLLLLRPPLLRLVKKNHLLGRCRAN